MKNIKYTLCVLIICTLAGCGQEIPVDVSARGAVIMNARSGRVLFEKNADKRFPPASTSKVMTAIVAIEHMPLTAVMTASKKAASMEPTIAGLKRGVKYQLKDLLSAILMKSGNDAAVAIAEGVAESEDNFAILMNAKAKEIGMKNTYFVTASGLPTAKKDSQHTTARDLATMMRYASRHKIILKIMSQKERIINGSDGEDIVLRTHNKPLLRGWEASWGKTGYTLEAKHTFVGVDPSHKPHIVFGMLQSRSLWNDVTTLKKQGLKLYRKKWWRSFF